jgi:hypothetical protein
MTVQLSDKLLNDHPRVRLNGLSVYGIVSGDIRTNHGWGEPYVFPTLPTPPVDAERCSALWRGYIANFRLYPDGRLQLIGYDYPFSQGKGHRKNVGAWLTGDFWMVLKRSFYGPRTYVPFREGVVVEDTAAWVCEAR